MWPRLKNSPHTYAHEGLESIFLFEFIELQWVQTDFLRLSDNNSSLSSANGMMVTSSRHDFRMRSFAIFNRVPSKSAIVLIQPEISRAYTTPFLSGVCSGKDLCLIEGDALTLSLTGLVLRFSFFNLKSATALIR